MEKLARGVLLKVPVDMFNNTLLEKVVK